MIKTELPENIQKAIQSGIPLHDVIHGSIISQLLEAEDSLDTINIESEGYEEDYEQTITRLHLEGYVEALTDIYKLCYDVVFYQRDWEKQNAN